MQASNNTVLELTEIKLLRMQDLDRQIAVLTAEKNMLKQQVIDSYFCDKPEYYTARGLLLATYKPIKSNRFQQKEFEKDHPDVACLYFKESISYRFDLK